MTFVVTTADGSVTVPDGVLLAISARAAESVDGVRVRRRRAIDVDGQVVRLSVAVRRGEPLVEVGERAQQEVADALKAMCGIDARVEISIGELE